MRVELLAKSDKKPIDLASHAARVCYTLNQELIANRLMSRRVCLIRAIIRPCNIVISPFIFRIFPFHPWYLGFIWQAPITIQINVPDAFPKCMKHRILR